MTQLRLTWRVAEVPSGPFRSFQKRCWPTARWPNGDIAAAIECADSYTPAKARGELPHAELIVRVADWSARTADGRRTFDWRKAKQRCATLPEAKALAERLLATHPEFNPANNP